MRYLSTLYVTDYKAKVSLSKHALKVTTSEGPRRIGMETIDALVLLGAGQITTDAIAACMEHNIQVAALKRSGRVRFIVSPPQRGNVHLRLAQVTAATDTGQTLDLARAFVAAKLHNSRSIIRRWARDARDDDVDRITARAELITERLSRLASVSTLDELRGFEGDAARAHFTAMGIVLNDTSINFTARTRRPPRDPVNALLSFCYGLLTTEVAGALEAVGLDPQIGFFHQPRPGRPALALDLVEELRPLTDRFSITLLRRRQLGPSSFTYLPGGAVYLNDQGRKDLLTAWENAKMTTLDHPVLSREIERWALPPVQATLLARHLRGDLPGYPAFTTKG